MSVINKVLRDLDSRAAGGGRWASDGLAGIAGDPMPHGVVAVSPLAAARPTPPARRVGWLPVLLASLLVAGAVLWRWQGPGGPEALPAGAEAIAVLASGPAQPMVAAEPVEVAPVPAASSADGPAAAVSEALFPPGLARPEVLASLPIPAPLPPPAAPQVTAAPVAAPAVLAGNSPPPGVRLAQPGPGLPASTDIRVAGTVPATIPVQRPEAADVAPLVVPPPVAWPEAALDTVGQAQRMWSSGARDTALAFLRDALAGVERAHGSDLAPDRAGATAGLAMVRELVRMEQLMANHVQVLALLKRHEVLWARQADLWAVRGSAAQRLSQHADAANSYRMALRLRPGEPRWMLGAAVSLAATGRQAEAAELAEQARRSGPVSPEVVSFLKQLGVQLAVDNPAN